MKKLFLVLVFLTTAVPAIEVNALPRGPLAGLGQGQGQGPLARIRERLQSIRTRIQERRAARAAAQQAQAQQAAAAQQASVQ